MYTAGMEVMMRLDKFLKVSRLIKRRTVLMKLQCRPCNDNGSCKASSDVKIV